LGLVYLLKIFNHLKKRLQENYLAQNYNEDIIDPDILGELSFSHIDFNLMNIMKQYEPYGQKNAKPKFITHNVIIEDVRDMGKEKEHRRFTFSHQGVIQQAVLFKTKELFQLGEQISVVYNISENHYNNRVSLQLIVDRTL
jgi:single-stranded-DNA-specific exonuclease